MEGSKYTKRRVIGPLSPTNIVEVLIMIFDLYDRKLSTLLKMLALQTEVILFIRKSALVARGKLYMEDISFKERN